MADFFTTLCEQAITHYREGDGDALIDVDAEIEKALEGFPGVKTQLVVSGEYLPNIDLKVSTILSDFTSIYGNHGVLMGTEGEAIDEWPAFLREYFGAALPPSSGVKVGKFFAFWTDAIYELLEPLAASGRVMIRPMTEVQVEYESGSRRVFIERDSPTELLISQPSTTQDALPIKTLGSAGPFESQLASVVVPHLENVSIPDLAKILDDEAHLLADFRSTINELVTGAAADPDRVADLYNDTVRPAVDKVDRKFKSIVQLHGLKAAGATVSTAVLGLVAFTDGGVAATLAKLMGPAGIGLIAKETAEFLKSKSELREMPHYLLWRLSKFSEHS